MEMPPSPSLVFKARKQKPELIRPAKPTPRECKILSDIDDQECFRFHIPIIQFFKHYPTMAESNKDPVEVIRHALSQALVFYYPFAGRLREGPGRKLRVDCNGEGVLFIEADADVCLHQFGRELHPPFSCVEELLCNFPGPRRMVNCPLLLIQVTRLMCGGFVFSVRLNHVMSDGGGLALFLNAVAEIARGADRPSVLPVWERELLNAREPPRVTCNHFEYDDDQEGTGRVIPRDSMIIESFFFGDTEISALCRFLPSHLAGCSRFEVLTGCLWRCRTIALSLHQSEKVRVVCHVNARKRFSPPLPVGYYGNAVALPAAVSTAGELCRNPPEYAVELVVRIKSIVTEEYMRSLADFLVLNGRPHYTAARAFVVSDTRNGGLDDTDFGWGKPVYAGVAKPEVASFFMAYANEKGERGVLATVCLPPPAMERFKMELGNIFNNGKSTILIKSTL